MKARSGEINNTRSIIERMQASFPHMYNVYDKKTILYALLTIFGKKYGMRTDIIDRLYAMIGIDSTYDEDLEHRWGSLLGVYKQFGESIDDYRDRLKIIYSSLSGGTAEAIKYAIASAAGIDSGNGMIDNYIHVYDAWEYPYSIDPSLLGIDEITDESSLYGSIICTIDIAGASNIIEHGKIMNAINRIKASGINPCALLLYNADESGSFQRNIDTSTTDIKYMPDDYIGLNTKDEESYIISENVDIPESSIFDGTGTHTGVWSSFGTNSAILNQSFVTNMYVQPDEYTDIIRYNASGNAIVLGTCIIGSAILGASEFNVAVFGVGILGQAIFGNGK